MDTLTFGKALRDRKNVCVDVSGMDQVERTWQPVLHLTVADVIRVGKYESINLPGLDVEHMLARPMPFSAEGLEAYGFEDKAVVTTELVEQLHDTKRLQGLRAATIEELVACHLAYPAKMEKPIFACGTCWERDGILFVPGMHPGVNGSRPKMVSGDFNLNWNDCRFLFAKIA